MEIGCALGGLLWHVRFLRESFRIICGVYARPRNIELKSHRSQEIMAMIPPFESRRVRIGETSLRVVQRGPAPQLGLELSAVPPALMANILFWNVNCRPLEHLLAAAVKLHDVDLLILAENKMPTSSVLQALNRERPGYKTRPWSICTKITVFTRFHISFLEPSEESDRVLICRLKLPARPDILIAMAHLPSKAHFDDAGQLAQCQLLSEAIKTQKLKQGTRRRS